MSGSILTVHGSEFEFVIKLQNKCNCNLLQLVRKLTVIKLQLLIIGDCKGVTSEYILFDKKNFEAY